MYRIKWEGYPDSDNTWEPVENLSDDLVQEYESSRNIDRRSFKSPKVPGLQRKIISKTVVHLIESDSYSEKSGSESVSNLKNNISYFEDSTKKKFQHQHCHTRCCANKKIRVKCTVMSLSILRHNRQHIQRLFCALIL